MREAAARDRELRLNKHSVRHTTVTTSLKTNYCDRYSCILNDFVLQQSGALRTVHVTVTQ